ncbi:MAG: hypothetical protein M3285_04285 [Actinomycetota bacterium]|nr:hypothetical protein [Actinomycetota bacterium]
MKRQTVVSAAGATILLMGALVVVPLARAGTPKCFGEKATKTIGSGASGHVYGTQGDDVIVGTTGYEAAVVVHGRDGHDRICVNSPGAPLKLEGGDGRDKMKGNRAQFFGGAGGDRIIDWLGSGFAEGGPGNDRITDTGGQDHFYGQGGDDYLDVSPQRGFAYGGPGTDTCVGNPQVKEGCEN